MGELRGITRRRLRPLPSECASESQTAGVPARFAPDGLPSREPGHAAVHGASFSCARTAHSGRRAFKTPLAKHVVGSPASPAEPGQNRLRRAVRRVGRRPWHQRIGRDGQAVAPEPAAEQGGGQMHCTLGCVLRQRAASPATATALTWLRAELRPRQPDLQGTPQLGRLPTRTTSSGQQGR